MLSVLVSAVALNAIPEGVSAKESSYQENQSEVKWGEINTKGLEVLLHSKIPMTLVDARKDKYFDGTLILGAKRLPSDSTHEAIEEILPNKHQLTVVYCAGEGCEASKNLAKRLVEMGYISVIEYHDGIRKWKALRKPTQKVKG